MQSHQTADMAIDDSDMENSKKTSLDHKKWLKWATLGLVSLINATPRFLCMLAANMPSRY